MASFDAGMPWWVANEPSSPLPAGLRQNPHKLRALGAGDQIALRDLLLGLDEPSRFSRFSCALGDDGIVRYAQYAASEAAWIAGAFAGDELCGAVELYETRDPRDLEAAFAVAGAWRRQGVGTALLFAAVRWAQQSERARLRMIFSRCNWAMRRLSGKADASLDLVLDECVASITIDDRAVSQLRRGPAEILLPV